MFPASLYHQCWIGNWEGEDARSCWLHDDLADFNTENPAVQQYLIDAYNKYIDMGVDGFRIDTAVHIPRVTWNRRFLPAHPAARSPRSTARPRRRTSTSSARSPRSSTTSGTAARSTTPPSSTPGRNASTTAADDVQAALEQFNYENQLGTGNQPTSTNAFLNGNVYHAPDHSQFSGMNIIDMRMHMNFGDAAQRLQQRQGLRRQRQRRHVQRGLRRLARLRAQQVHRPATPAARTPGPRTWRLMWTFRGIPTLYYGSEIEFQAGKQIDCGPTCPLANTGRAYYGDQRGGHGHRRPTTAWSPAPPVRSPPPCSKPLVKHVQRLNQIRRAVPALQMGQYSTDGRDRRHGLQAPLHRAARVDSFALVAVSSTRHLHRHPQRHATPTPSPVTCRPSPTAP